MSFLNWLAFCHPHVADLLCLCAFVVFLGAPIWWWVRTEMLLGGTHDQRARLFLLREGMGVPTHIALDVVRG